MLNINEYLDYKKVVNKEYRVSNGKELFDTHFYVLTTWIDDFTHWFFNELKNSKMLQKNEYEEFEKNNGIAFITLGNYVTQIEDKENICILKNIKPNKYTYRDIFEILVNYYNLNQKNIKIV
jgi:hypothetical protein